MLIAIDHGNFAIKTVNHSFVAGLSEHTEEVLRDWTNQCDGMFLFANETVLDFYPKFGFRRETQYQIRPMSPETPHLFIRGK